MIKNAIQLENISKTFYIPREKRDTFREKMLRMFHKNEMQEFHAVKNLSLVVPKGEFLGIIGRNGSGKSTLLKIIAKIYRPNKGGTVSIHGRISPFLELGVGFNPELSARENVYLNATILGLTKKEIAERFDDIIAFAELEEFVEQKLKYFSSGMQVRLAFAVAIQVNADVLLLDEVLAVGDLNFQRKCFSVFDTMKKEGKTIVYVSHDLESVKKFSDRVIYMEHGEIRQEGNAEKVIEHYIKDSD